MSDPLYPPLGATAHQALPFFRSRIILLDPAFSFYQPSLLQIRAAILAQREPSAIAGGINGKAESWDALFLRIFKEPLIVKAKRRRGQP